MRLLSLSIAIALAACSACSNPSEELTPGASDAGVDDDAGAGADADVSLDASTPPMPSARCVLIETGGTTGTALAGDLCIFVVNDIDRPIANATVQVTCGAQTIEGVTSRSGHLELHDPCLSGSIDVHATADGFHGGGVYGVPVDAVTVPLASRGTALPFGSITVELSAPTSTIAVLTARSSRSTAEFSIGGDRQTLRTLVPDRAHFIFGTANKIDDRSWNGLLAWGTANIGALDAEPVVELDVNRRFREHITVRGRSVLDDHTDFIRASVRAPGFEPDIPFASFEIGDAEIELPIFDGRTLLGATMHGQYTRVFPAPGRDDRRVWVEVELAPNAIIDGDTLDYLDPPSMNGTRPLGAGVRTKSCLVRRDIGEFATLWILDDRTLENDCHSTTAYDGEGFDPANVRFHDVVHARRGSRFGVIGR